MAYLTEDREKFAKYRWEFMRRNPGYQQDWHELEQILEGVERRTAEDEPCRAEARFSEKWGIGEIRGYTQLLFDPAKKFEELLSELPFDNPEATKMLRHDVLFPFSQYRQPITEISIDESERYETNVEKRLREAVSIDREGFLTIQVDLNYSEKRLKEDFEKLLKEKKQMYEEQKNVFATIDFLKSKDPDFFDLGIEFEDPFRGMQNIIVDRGYAEEYREYMESKFTESEGYKIKPHHYDNFDLYLKVYDLRQQEKTWAEIADLLGFSDPYNNKQRRIDKARNAYNSARKIIKDGIEPYINGEIPA